jgi:YhcH/YjgK/YiaL family protein
MLHALLDEPESYEPWMAHPVWRKATGWLRALDPSIPLGRHELQGDKMFALVQTYDTVQREAARFESHREHIDIQCTLSGEEAIDWHPRGGLSPDGPFENDVQFWLPPSTPYATLIHSPRRFSVFLPPDAHRPKVRAAAPSVVKLVIKIHVSLFE